LVVVVLVADPFSFTVTPDSGLPMASVIVPQMATPIVPGGGTGVAIVESGAATVSSQDHAAT
jgi:hypothetical protein